MKLSIEAGATSVSVPLFIQDSSSTTGAGLTGLAYNSGSLTAYYLRPGGSATAITLATLAAISSNWSSGGFKEADSTNLPGTYRLDIPDACLAPGARSVVIMLKGATNMAPCVLEIDLLANVGVDKRGTATGSSSTTITDSGWSPGNNTQVGKILRIWDSTNGWQERMITANTAGAMTVDQWTATPTGTVLYEVLAAPPASATLPATANLTSVLGTAITESASGRLAAALVAFLNVASPALTVASVNQTGDGYGIIHDGTVGNAALKSLIDAVGVLATAIKANTDLLPSGTMNTYSMTQILTALSYVLLGKSTGGGSSYKKQDGTTAGIDYTLDGSNNRTGVTLH